MWDLLIGKEVTYDLRAKDLLHLPKARTVLNDLNSIVFRGSILCIAISKVNAISDFEGRKLSMQAVSHFHSELGLFMMFLKICFIAYFDEL